MGGAAVLPHWLEDMTTHDADAVKHGIDVLAASVAVGAIVKVLPAIASLFTIIWLAIRIWETDTVRKWTNRS